MSSAASSAPFNRTQSAQAAGADPSAHQGTHGAYADAARKRAADEAVDIDLREQMRRLNVLAKKIFATTAMVASKAAEAAIDLARRLIEMMMWFLRKVASLFGLRQRPGEQQGPAQSQALTGSGGASSAPLPEGFLHLGAAPAAGSRSAAPGPLGSGPSGPQKKYNNDDAEDAQVVGEFTQPQGSSVPPARDAAPPLRLVGQLMREKADEVTEFIERVANEVDPESLRPPEGATEKEAAEHAFVIIGRALIKKIDLLTLSRERESEAYRELMIKLKVDASIAHGIPEGQIDEALRSDSHLFSDASLFKKLAYTIENLKAEDVMSRELRGVAIKTLEGMFPGQTHSWSDSKSGSTPINEPSRSVNTSEEVSANNASMANNTHASSETLSSPENASLEPDGLEPDGPMYHKDSRLVSDPEFMAAASPNQKAYGARSPEAGESPGDESPGNQGNRRDPKNRPQAA